MIPQHDHHVRDLLMHELVMTILAKALIGVAMNHPATAVTLAAMISSAESNIQGRATINSAQGIGERSAMKESGRAA
eukprot:2599847-Alexandrium_andersonii.AAC.1